MRLFKDFNEARNEIKRDLKEMGIKVQNTHMQDKVGSFPTVELYNYGYTVLLPNPDHLNPTQPWLIDEWEDRKDGILGSPKNPGVAWEQRPEIWNEFLEYQGKVRNPGDPIGGSVEFPLFSYTYSERFSLNQQVLRIIRELKENPESRQLYVGMWDPDVDSERLGKRRVPCSLGWHFLYREQVLNVTYTMRSCDFLTHWENDCCLTLLLQEFIANAAGVKAGKFSQFINSFHVYEKDVADVF